MRKAIACALSALVLMAADCEQLGHEDGDEPIRTPAGHYVQIKNQGTLSTGLATKDEILVAFDAAFAAAATTVAAELGMSIESVTRTGDKISWQLIDDCLIRHEDIQTNRGHGTWVWPSGAYSPRVCAYEAFYSDDPLDIDPDSPAWTRWTFTDFTFEGTTYPEVHVWGDPELTVPFPSLVHALRYVVTSGRVR